LQGWLGSNHLHRCFVILDHISCLNAELCFTYQVSSRDHIEGSSSLATSNIQVLSQVDEGVPF